MLACRLVAGAEAALLDPQQRVLLEETASLLSHSGCNSGMGQVARNEQTTVAVGIAKLGEAPTVAAGNAAAVAAGSSYVGTGQALSAAAGRISYCFGLKGPSGMAQARAVFGSWLGLHGVTLGVLARSLIVACAHVGLHGLQFWSAFCCACRSRCLHLTAGHSF